MAIVFFNNFALSNPNRILIGICYNTSIMKALLDFAIMTGGGLGAFLLGMRHLSDGLQASGGPAIRKFMAMATGHRLAGVMTGVTSTIIMQSSSIVTVMLVGFVVSQMMTLAAAIYVLIGANIGTTFTVWIMAAAPSPETLGLALFSIGSLCYFPPRKWALRYFGLALIGLGLVFIGMFLMKEGVAPVKSSPSLSGALASLDAGSFAGVLLVAAVSALFTAVIQSSAAGIVIFMTLASEGLVSYETAVAALFGANVGTTATGWLAAIGGGSAAKRLASAHTFTNVAGSLVCLPLVLPVFIPLGKFLCPNWQTSVMLPIALTDTLFAVVRGALVFPFARPLAALLERLVPDRADEKPHLSVLSPHARISTVIACEQALEEVGFMADSVIDMADHLRQALAREIDRREAARHLQKREEILDRVQSEIAAFLGSIMVKRLSPYTAYSIKRILRLADEFESVSDEFPRIMFSLGRLESEGENLAGSDLAMILDIHHAVAELISFSRADLLRFAKLGAKRALSDELKGKIRSARQLQLLRVGGGSSAGTVMAMMDILSAYNRLRTYAINIAEACADGQNMV